MSKIHLHMDTMQSVKQSTGLMLLAALTVTMAGTAIGVGAIPLPHLPVSFPPPPVFQSSYQDKPNVPTPGLDDKHVYATNAYISNIISIFIPSPSGYYCYFPNCVEEGGGLWDPPQLSAKAHTTGSEPEHRSDQTVSYPPSPPAKSFFADQGYVEPIYISPKQNASDRHDINSVYREQVHDGLDTSAQGNVSECSSLMGGWPTNQSRTGMATETFVPIEQSIRAAEPVVAASSTPSMCSAPDIPLDLKATGARDSSHLGQGFDHVDEGAVLISQPILASTLNDAGNTPTKMRSKINTSNGKDSSQSKKSRPHFDRNSDADEEIDPAIARHSVDFVGLVPSTLSPPHALNITRSVPGNDESMMSCAPSCKTANKEMNALQHKTECGRGRKKGKRKIGLSQNVTEHQRSGVSSQQLASSCNTTTNNVGRDAAPYAVPVQRQRDLNSATCAEEQFSKTYLNAQKLYPSTKLYSQTLNLCTSLLRIRTHIENLLKSGGVAVHPHSTNALDFSLPEYIVHMGSSRSPFVPLDDVVANSPQSDKYLCDIALSFLDPIHMQSPPVMQQSACIMLMVTMIAATVHEARNCHRLYAQYESKFDLPYLAASSATCSYQNFVDTVYSYKLDEQICKVAIGLTKNRANFCQFLVENVINNFLTITVETNTDPSLLKNVEFKNKKAASEDILHHFNMMNEASDFTTSIPLQYPLQEIQGNKDFWLSTLAMINTKHPMSNEKVVKHHITGYDPTLIKEEDNPHEALLYSTSYNIKMAAIMMAARPFVDEHYLLDVRSRHIRYVAGNCCDDFESYLFCNQCLMTFVKETDSDYILEKMDYAAQQCVQRISGLFSAPIPQYLLDQIDAFQRSFVLNQLKTSVFSNLRNEIETQMQRVHAARAKQIKPLCTSKDVLAEITFLVQSVLKNNIFPHLQSEVTDNDDSM